MTPIEALVKLMNHLENQGNGRLVISRNQRLQEYVVGYEFGEEEPGSDMYGGAAYGVGTLGEAIQSVVEQVGIKDES